MLRKRSVGVMAVLVAFVLAFGFVGCDTGNGSGGGNGGNDGNGGGTAGKLTINNLPTVQSVISVGVWDYQGAFNTKGEYNSVTTTSSIATSVGGSLQKTQPVSLYQTSTTTGFSRSGTFMVQISTGNTATLDEPRYYGKVVFTQWKRHG